MKKIKPIKYFGANFGEPYVLNEKRFSKILTSIWKNNSHRKEVFFVKIPTYVINVLKKRKYYYWTISRNGEVLAHSESYSSRYAARKTAKHLFEKIIPGWCEYNG